MTIEIELRAAALDKDNMPRMDSERWLPVGLAMKAADEIERLRAENTKLRAALEEISAVYGELDVTPSRMCAIARTALTGKE